jgi:hypothetical protein
VLWAESPKIKVVAQAYNSPGDGKTYGGIKQGIFFQGFKSAIKVVAQA